MKKVPFNQGGLDLKISMINDLSQDEFRKQLDLIQFETQEWVINNFDLVQEQVDYLKIIPKEILNQLGLTTSMCIMYKLPLNLITPDVYQPPIQFKRHVKVTVEGGSTWGPGGGPNIGDYTGTITFSFP